MRKNVIEKIKKATKQQFLKALEDNAAITQMTQLVIKVDFAMQIESFVFVVRDHFLELTIYKFTFYKNMEFPLNRQCTEIMKTVCHVVRVV